MTAPAFDCLFSVEDRRKRREMRGYPRTRTQAATLTTLASLPDDTLLQVIAACGKTDGVPLLEAVRGLGCVTQGMRQQIYRLQPLVGVRSLAVVQRASQRQAWLLQGFSAVGHGPWRVTLLYHGELTGAVVEQARQGRVRSIYMCSTDIRLPPAVAGRVVPELLGAGCSLLELKLDCVKLNRTWASIFGEAAVCSAALRSLWLTGCWLRGPLPELRLPALQHLCLDRNYLTGSLEPLRSCTALQELQLMSNNLTGGLEPLRGCTALRELDFEDTQLILSNEDKTHFEKQCGWDKNEEP